MIQLLLLLSLTLAAPMCDIYGTYQWNGTAFNPEDGDTYVSALLTIYPNNTVLSEVYGFSEEGFEKTELDSGIYEYGKITYDGSVPDIPRPSNLVFGANCQTLTSAENPLEEFTKLENNVVVPKCDVYGTYQWNGSAVNLNDGDTYVESFLTIYSNNTVVCEVFGFDTNGTEKVEFNEGIYENNTITYLDQYSDIPRPSNLVFSADCQTLTSAENPLEEFTKLENIVVVPKCDVYGTYQWNGSAVNLNDGDIYTSSILTIYPNNTVISEVFGFGPDGAEKVELDEGIYENTTITYFNHYSDIPRPSNIIWCFDCASFNSAENPNEKFIRLGAMLPINTPSVAPTNSPTTSPTILPTNSPTRPPY